MSTFRTEKQLYINVSSKVHCGKKVYSVNFGELFSPRENQSNVHKQVQLFPLVINKTWILVISANTFTLPHWLAPRYWEHCASMSLLLSKSWQVTAASWETPIIPCKPVKTEAKLQERYTLEKVLLWSELMTARKEYCRSI